MGAYNQLYGECEAPFIVEWANKEVVDRSDHLVAQSKVHGEDPSMEGVKPMFGMYVLPKAANFSLTPK